MSNMKDYQNLVWNSELSLYNAIKNKEYDSEIVKAFISDSLSAIGDDIVGVVSCMDDRLSIVDGSIRIAGSGILLARELGFVKVAEIFKSLQGEKITTHNDCGAAGLYAKAENLIDDIPDEVARKIVDKFSKENGFEHEYVGTIDKPHAARSIFVDTTARFNPIKVSSLPEAFVVTEKLIPASHIFDQINVAVNIATGDHGFGEKINSENPFFIFVLGSKGYNIDLDLGLEQIVKERNGLVDIMYIDLV